MEKKCQEEILTNQCREEDIKPAVAHRSVCAQLRSDTWLLEVDGWNLVWVEDRQCLFHCPIYDFLWFELFLESLLSVSVLIHHSGLHLYHYQCLSSVMEHLVLISLCKIRYTLTYIDHLFGVMFYLINTQMCNWIKLWSQTQKGETLAMQLVILVYLSLYFLLPLKLL